MFKARLLKWASFDASCDRESTNFILVLRIHKLEEEAVKLTENDSKDDDKRTDKLPKTSISHNISPQMEDGLNSTGLRSRMRA